VRNIPSPVNAGKLLFFLHFYFFRKSHYTDLVNKIVIAVTG